MIPTLRRPGSSERAQATVELVALLPVIVLALFAAVDLGLFAAQRVGLTNAARAGARAASVVPVAERPSAVDLGALRSAARRAAFGDAERPGGAPELDVRVEPGPGRPVVAVTVRGTYSPVTPGLGRLLGPREQEATVVMALEG